ncbi:MAG: glycosyltransferase [Bacteroidetes bacterium]|nr:glycosyltransferase [Bacteroidota bacterium]
MLKPRIYKAPVISIVITYYNRKKLLLRAIDSVLNQSYQDFELIIVDDGSSDDAYKEIFRLINIDYRIKYARHSNRKTQLSLNAGIRMSSGKFITFLDSDDEFAKNHLSTRISFFKKNKHTDLIYSNAALIGKEDDMWVPDAKNQNKLIHLDDCIIGATLFGKEHVFRQLGGFRNVYSHDSDFVKRAEKKFKVEKFISPTYIYHRESHDSILTNLKKKTR